MGTKYFGIPTEEAEFLQQLLDLKVFVEGGTYLGNTARQMSGRFQEVITIERSSQMFDRAHKNLSNYDNISLMNGDTREYLPQILKQHDKILFWLDAHWSGGDTYGANDECPLLEELEIIFTGAHHRTIVVLIDDARLFLSPPPLPHDASKWPTLDEIVRMIPQDWRLYCNSDVLYLLPRESAEPFSHYLQRKTTVESKELTTITFSKKGALGKLYHIGKKLRPGRRFPQST